MTTNKQAPLIVVVGETASGKSSLGLLLAKHLNGEIISADSWAVYKGFDIGTAKPSKSDQLSVKHHVIDVANPANGFSAAEFKTRAQAAIAHITSIGKVPILIGGSGLYVDSVIYGYNFLPASSPKLRSQLNELDLSKLKAVLINKQIDTTDIDLRNKRRLIRLLENNGQRPTKEGLRPNTLIIGIHIPKSEIAKRVEQRVGQMMNRGLKAEVLRLSKTFGWDVEPMKGIGYSEFQEYFTGQQTLAETKQRIINATLKLAKKQRTWFKRNKYIQWIDDPKKAVALATTFLNK